METIQKDKEILIDYSLIMAKDDDWSMNCNCGESNCRELILKLNLLPEKIKNNYVKIGAIPEYILNVK